MFVQRAKRKVRELVYNYDTDGFIAPDLTILAEHISDSGITEMSYQQEPQSILWCVRTDGILIGLTYARNEQVVGWHRHIFGGVFGSGNAVVESVATIPGDLNEDVTYVIVKRTINGATRRYVEYLQPVDYGSDLTAAFFVDSGLTYSGGATTTISGLHHLIGQSVTILADGSTHPNKTVSATGTITLDRSSTKVQIGLNYNSTLQTMRLEAGSQDGTAHEIRYGGPATHTRFYTIFYILHIYMFVYKILYFSHWKSRVKRICKIWENEQIHRTFIKMYGFINETY